MYNPVPSTTDFADYPLSFSAARTLLLLLLLSLTACKSTKNDVTSDAEPVGPAFNADSAYAFCAAQCEFGPRTMNSEAHEQCAQWIVSKFQQYGCGVKIQKADLKGYDGTVLKATNIIASYRPEATTRILLCAHWDSRPWADNDPDSANHKKPVLAANDGASGVAVMLEIARLLRDSVSTPSPQGESERVTSPSLNREGQGRSLSVGVDFVCLDAEDWGFPMWEKEKEDPGDTWALGAQYFSANLPQGYEARFGILLDMVGGEGAQFFKEGMSMELANAIVNKVWAAAKVAGYGNFFPDKEGGYVTDDHLPLNKTAGIPTIDIIPFYPDCTASSFGPTWHTLKDDMEHIDRNTLKAVCQTIIQLLISEQ